MTIIPKIISWIALLIVVVVPLLYLKGSMELPTVKNWLLIATIVWFVSASFYMWKDDETAAEPSESSGS